MNIPTPHISANYGDFAKTVLMPGDPKRADFIANAFLSEVKVVSDVRGIKGYTGLYNGKKVSVMASGMGQPSIGIYTYELYNFYGVDTIIRVGSMGGFDEKLHALDIVIVSCACTDGNFAKQYNLPGTFCPTADFDLVVSAKSECEKIGAKHYVGTVLSTDVFYGEEDVSKSWNKMGVLGVEMESFALYCNALRAKKKALCICTVSDSFVHKEENLTSKEREQSLVDMIKVALEVATKE